MAENAMIGGVVKRRARQRARAVKEAKRTAGTRERAASIERAMTGRKGPAVTPSSRRTRRGLAKKVAPVIEKTLGRHGSKGRKRASAKG
jgi:hypothetical protein